MFLFRQFKIIYKIMKEKVEVNYVRDNKVRIRIHDVMEFLRCRRAWDLSSSLRKNLTQVQPNKNLFLGTGIHYALQYYYDPATFNEGILIDPIEPFEEWFEEEKQKLYSENEVTVELEEMLKEQFELGVGMLGHYAKWAPQHDDFTVIGTELELQVPLKLPSKFEVAYGGRIDKLIQDSYGKFWVVDFKTWAQIDLDRLKLEMQPSAYLWALKEQYDLEVEGVMYIILRKKVPRRPSLLASGRLSKARNIDTTYEVYLNEVREHNLNPDDYAEILEHLKEKGNTFFVREHVIRTKREIEEFGDRLSIIVSEMLSTQLAIYPAPEAFKCRLCQFKPVCLAYAEGQDVDFILETQFKHRDESQEPYELLDSILSDIILY